MKNYIVKSFHEIFVDDYNDGEGKHVNTYALSDEIQAETPKQAINKYLQDCLGYDLDFNSCEVNPDDKSNVQTSCLVDGYNIQPTNSEVKQWKAGNVELYANYIDLFVYEVIKVNF